MFKGLQTCVKISVVNKYKSGIFKNKYFIRVLGHNRKSFKLYVLNIYICVDGGLT